MKAISPADIARRWRNVPNLPPEVEAAAAEVSLGFLHEVRALVKEHIGAEDPDADFHKVWDFERFDPAHLDFLIATLGEGEVRVKLYNGEVKVADTGIPGLWRMQSGRDGEVNSFILGRLPLAVRAVATTGLEEIPKLVNPGPTVFAAPAILEELRHRLPSVDFDHLSSTPPYMVELTKQPLSPGDMTALLSTLGKGPVEIELFGMATTSIIQTAVRGVWHMKILNNIGKTLLDAFTVCGVPPELPIAQEEWKDALEEIDDRISWIEGDLERGALGPASTTVGSAS